MKKLILVLALAAPLLITESMAGPITSGGGFAVVCRNLKGRIETAEILDLYEARTKYGFTIIETKDDVEEDIRSVAINSNRVDGIDAHPSSPQSLRFINDEIKEIQHYIEQATYLPINFKLPEVNDLGLHAAPPKGCQVEQVAFFDDSTNNLKISTSIWNELNSLNQVALIYHEHNYLIRRQRYKDINSVVTRGTVAVYFSTDSPSRTTDEQRLNYAKGLILGESVVPYEQYDRGVEFYHSRKDNILTLNLTRIAKLYFTSRTAVTFDIGNIKLKSIYRQDINKDLVYTNSTVPMTLKSHSDSILLDIDVEIIIVPGKPMVGRFFKDGQVIFEGPFTHFNTMDDMFEIPKK